MSNATLSPDGRFVALEVAGDSGRMCLAVIDVERPKEVKVVAAFNDGDVASHNWVNSERLVLTSFDAQRPDRPIRSGLYAVNRDGSDWRELIRANDGDSSHTGSHITSRVLPWQWQLQRVLRDGSADVIVQSNTWDAKGEPITINLARLDTVTGTRTDLSAGAPDAIEEWFVDSKGRPVAVWTGAGARRVAYLHGDAGWSKWQDVSRFEGKGLDPVALGDDGSMFVLTRGDANFWALYRYDVAKGKLDDRATFGIEGFDFDGTLVFEPERRRLIGIRYESDAQGVVWLDEAMQKLQAEIDKQLPTTINSIDCGNCGNTPVVLVTTLSDRMPPAYFLYRREAHRLEPIGAARPWIVPGQMGQRDLFRFKARDGMSIPVLVTRKDPKAAVPRPAVVLVHGGPWVRGTHWDWEAMAQFLASRGYVVIEPEFRGSTGYGFELFRSGWKQWGLAMQDDVADAALWAVRQGWADPGRICIGGASYGGYATLMGLIRNADLYRCGFEWVGVSDIGLMYSIHWSDFSEAWTHIGLPVLVGDRIADAKQLDDTSPVKQALRMKRPLLMAYGANDYRVPIEHGQAFRDAVSGGNKDVEWIVYDDEGHGWTKLETNLDFWGRVETFLSRHIGAMRASGEKANAPP